MKIRSSIRAWKKRDKESFMTRRGFRVFVLNKKKGRMTGCQGMKAKSEGMKRSGDAFSVSYSEFKLP